MQKGFFVLLLALFLGSGTAYAYDFSKIISGKTFYFNIINSTQHYVEITYPGTSSNPWGGHTQPSGNITLPTSVSYNGVTYSVTRIGNYAFYQCSDLTGSLTIPNSVTSIGNSAFCLCDGFRGSLTIGDNVTTIGNEAFSGCGGVHYNVGFTGTLTLGASVATIGNSAFAYCDGFTGSLTLPNSLTSIGDDAFAGCDGFTGSLTIPNPVTSIGSYAFGNCEGFSGTLTIGTGVTSIGWAAFSQCTGFTHVKYNATNCGAISSSDTPFVGCGGTLTIGTNVASIPLHIFDEGDFSPVNFNAVNCADVDLPSPFENCSGALVIGNSVTRIPANMFNDCIGFTSLTIGNSVTEIGACAFRYCSYSSYGLSGNLVIPNSVTTIGSYAFDDCSHFAGYTLTIGTGVTSIGTGAFRHCGFSQVNYNATNCANVTSSTKPFEGCGGTLIIGSNVTRIPAYLFYQCSGFTGSLNIPSSVISIGDSAFSNCTGFSSSLSIGNNVNTIGASAFYKCTGFTSLSLGTSVNTIDMYAFYQCSGLLGTLTIPASVVTIKTYAFALCSGLQSVNIGSNVHSIAYGAFYNCNGLASMTVFPETPPTLNESVFYNVSKTIPVYVPCGSLEAYQSAYGWNEFSNYLCNPTVTVTAVPTAGGSVSGGGNYSSGTSVTVTATPNSNYVFMNWSKDGVVVSSNPSYTFTVTQDVVLEAAFMQQAYLGDIIGESSDGSSVYLPSYSYYKYSLSEQIYTSSEMGSARTITTISFFNAGATRTRTYDIYMKHTTKTSFDSGTDWVSVTSSNKVYSGSVTMRAGLWTTIVLTTPFSYNGSSNLLLVVDDNTGSYTSSPYMSCRTYTTSGNQALRIYSDGTNYNPSSPSSYAGTPMGEKNQIMLNREGGYNIVATTPDSSAGTVNGGGQYGLGDLCRLKATAYSGYTFMDWTDGSGVVVSTDPNYSFVVTESRNLTANFILDDDLCGLTFDLFDSYGDGWNGNQLVVEFGNGMTKHLTLTSGSKATFTLPVELFDWVELTWIESNWAYECSFAVSDEFGVKYVGSNLNGYFEHTIVSDCSGNSELTYLGNYGLNTNNYLPSYSFYCYSLSEQIYTADEIGTSGLINSIAFYNGGTETKTRNLRIYLATTSKTAFESQTDWISTDNAQLMFNGNVTMYAGRWTPIIFDNTAFDYDGISNLVLIVDDNTGSYTNSPHMSCKVYPADGLQALRVFSDGTNYDPSSPSSYTGTLMNVKNQIMLNITTCEEPLNLMATDITATSANIDWTSNQNSYDLQYRELGANNDFEMGLGQWTTIDADGDGHNWTTLDEFPANYSYYSNLYLDWMYEGNNAILSASYINSVGALHPDNYLVSPRVTLGGTFGFWAAAADPNYPADVFGVFVSTGSGTNPSDFVEVQSWTMTAKDEGRICDGRATRDGGGLRVGSWYYYEVDLSAYSGLGYIAIRHYNSYDQYILCIDDISYTQPGSSSSWITHYNVFHPHALTGLTPGTYYEVRVRSNCVGNNYSDWVYTTFTTDAQTLALAAGWNWVSFNTEITMTDLQAALLAAYPSPGMNALVVKSKGNGQTAYNPTANRWIGSLTTLNLSQMYMVKVPSAHEITMVGMPVNPANHPATIAPGANWIAFPLSQSMSITNAFAGFPTNGDIIKAKSGGQAQWNSGANRWIGALVNTPLEPGYGYIYNSKATGNRTFTFPVSAK